MFDARRPLGRLFCLLLLVLAALQVSQAQNPATTTINDIVYRADGTPAGGTLLISWPVFNTAGGQAVAAGTKSVTLGTGGALAVALVPNTGATPSGTFYTVVYQLNDLKEELRRLQERLSRDPEDDLAVRVLFRDYAEAYFTWVGKWRIIYIRQNPDAYVVHIDNEMEQTRG